MRNDNTPNMSTGQMLRDLVFTLIIPIAVLSPNLLGSGLSAAEFLGGGQSGNIRAYLLAALIPVGYVAWDLIRNRNLSPVAIMGGAGALLSGALAFWYVDGLLYALKDSARSYAFGIAFLVSAFINMPLTRIILEMVALGSSEDEQSRLKQAIQQPSIFQALKSSSIAFGIVDIVGGLVNSVVNYLRVVAPFGSSDFNAQIAEVNAIMRMPTLVISFVGMALAYFILQKATKAAFGEEANLFEPSTLPEARPTAQTVQNA